MDKHVIALNNGVEMPLAGLGTWDLRGDNCISTVSTAIELGYRLIDTAQMYQNEREVGEGIRRSGINRQDLFVTTKIYSISNSLEKARVAIDRSLDDLGLTYVDLLLLHEPYIEGPEMYMALEEALKDGRARAIGISNYNERWYSEFLDQCGIVPAVNQMEVHVLFQRWDFQKKMTARGTVMQAWAPLAQGIGNIAGNELLKEIGKKYSKTAAQVALRFLVQRGIPVIPKSQHPERLAENLNIFDFSLSEEDISRIGGMDRNRTLFPWTEEF